MAKASVGAGGEVVDDLRHRPALVGRLSAGEESSRTSTGVGLPQGLPGPGRSPLATSARRRRVAARRVAVEGVGEDADGDAAAVDAEGGARGGGVELRVALGDDRAAAVAAADDGASTSVTRGDPGDRGDRAQVGGAGARR